MGGRKRKDLTGERFGLLTVIEPSEKTVGKWICRCVCGKMIEATTRNLCSGNTKSCGCIRKKREHTNAWMSLPSRSGQRVHLDPVSPYVDLANAIVATAADDYRYALRHNDEKLLVSLERFFYSKWYQALTRLDADILLEGLRTEKVLETVVRNRGLRPSILGKVRGRNGLPSP